MPKKQPKQGAIDREAEAHAKSGLHSLLMMVVGALVAVMIGAFIYLSPFFNEKTLDVNGKAATVVPLPEKTDNDEKTEYHFYDVLPKQNFHSIPEGLSEPTAQEQNKTLHIDAVVHDERQADDTDTAVIAEDESDDDYLAPQLPDIKISAGDITYILQIFSYDNAADADQRRAEVIMAGVDAQVLRRDLGNGNIIYQVVSEPLANREVALHAYERLKRNGIDALVVEQHH